MGEAECVGADGIHGGAHVVQPPSALGAQAVELIGCQHGRQHHETLGMELGHVRLGQLHGRTLLAATGAHG